jgi:hypothetical protein
LILCFVRQLRANFNNTLRRDRPTDEVQKIVRSAPYPRWVVNSHLPPLCKQCTREKKESVDDRIVLCLGASTEGLLATSTAVARSRSTVTVLRAAVSEGRANAGGTRSSAASSVDRDLPGGCGGRSGSSSSLGSGGRSSASTELSVAAGAAVSGRRAAVSVLRAAGAKSGARACEASSSGA